jgi:hypothetical protein
MADKMPICIAFQYNTVAIDIDGNSIAAAAFVAIMFTSGFKGFFICFADIHADCG